MDAAFHTISYYRGLEADAFSKIPGMTELRSCRTENRDELHEKYPDAVFAAMLADSLLTGDRELSAINQKAYLSILKGENIADVRFRYDRETDTYWKRHMWDD